MSDLGPPPAPRPVTMPTMTEEEKKKFGGGRGGGPVAGGGGGGPPMMGSPMPMMGGPMMGSPMMGGCPTIGGMGPNLVFNFYQPYGMAMAAAAVGGGEEEEEKKEEKKCPPILVQGDPTWRRPRMPVKKGDKLKDDPCVIM